MMNSAVAKLSALTLVGLLAISITALIVTSNPGLSGTTVKAEFKDVSPLVEGMSVRVSGAVAGSVRDIELTDQGRVKVTMQLHDGLPDVREDASAAIRQQDLLGDSYLALELGHSPKRLEGLIKPERSVTSPRFDEFFDIFKKETRDGFRALMAEFALALDRRGADLNEAILNLRPRIEVADDLLTEVNSQNRALATALDDARAISRRLATRTRSLDKAISAFAATAGGVANHSGGLDASLAQLPQALSAGIGTMRSLRRFAVAMKPFANTIAAGAPAFERSSRLLVDWVPHAAAGIRSVAPFLALAGRALKAAKPGLRRLRGKDLNLLLGPASQLATLLEPVFGDVTEGLFGSRDGGGLGGIGVPGNDATQPDTDPLRYQLTGSLMITCEMFGKPVRPGCLQEALSQSSANSAEQEPRERRASEAAPKAPAAPAAPAPGPAEPANPSGGLTGALDRLLKPLLDPREAPPPPKDVGSLLDYLLGS